MSAASSHPRDAEFLWSDGCPPFDFYVALALLHAKLASKSSGDAEVYDDVCPQRRRRLAPTFVLLARATGTVGKSGAQPTTSR